MVMMKIPSKSANLVKNITKLSNGTYAAADEHACRRLDQVSITSSSASGKVQLSAETLLGLWRRCSDKL